MGVQRVLEKPVSPSGLYDVLMDAGARTGPSEVAEPLTHGQPLLGLRVLVAEDNHINQLVASELLKDAGAIATLVDDGLAAVQALEADELLYDMVWMDVQMPRMDGREATRKIRERFSADELPIIALTAHAGAEEYRMCLEAGMDDVVTKPLDPVRLMSVSCRLAKLAPPDEAGVPAKQSDPGPFAALVYFNTTSGLSRVRGNQALYTKLLRSFAADYVNLADAIGTLLATNDLTGARDLVHGARGAAGNVGAEGVFASATALEHALESDSQSSAEVDAFSEQLSLALADLVELDLVEPDVPAGPRLDAEALHTRLAKLHALLEADDADALTCMTGLWAQLAEGEDSALVDALREQVASFAFDEALDTMSSLRAALPRG